MLLFCGTIGGFQQFSTTCTFSVSTRAAIPRDWSLDLRFATSGAVTVVPILQSCELRSFLSCRAVCREWHGDSASRFTGSPGAMKSCMIVSKRITSLIQLDA